MATQKEERLLFEDPSSERGRDIANIDNSNLKTSQYFKISENKDLSEIFDTNSVKLKRLTGEDPIPGRLLYQKLTKTRFHITMTSNYDSDTEYNGHSTWRSCCTKKEL